MVERIQRKRVAPNLYLVTRGNGTRFYKVRMMVSGKALEKTVGLADDMTLRQAKTRAAALIGNIEKQPKEQKKTSPQFKEIVFEALEDIEQVKRWRSSRSSQEWRSSIVRYALPTLGSIKVAAISRDDILEVLRPIWRDKTETASRLQQRLSAVFDWCIVKGFRSDNPAQWRSNLSFFLPNRSKLTPVEHHDAPSLDEVRKIVRFCLDHPSAVSGCILLSIATVCRVSEARQATMEQIRKVVWFVPGAAQKVDRGERRVPLTSLAMEAVKMGSETGYLFQGFQGMIALDSPRLKIIEILGRKTTAHGIRSTFRDWCARSGIDHDTAERCLSHQVGSKTEQAYLRDDFFEQRKAALEAWKDALIG